MYNSYDLAPTHNCNWFPGISWVGELLTCTICQILLVMCYASFSFWLRYYLPNTATPTTLLGLCLNFIASSFMAIVQVQVLAEFYLLNDIETSVAIMGFIALNMSMVIGMVYRRHSERKE